MRERMTVPSGNPDFAGHEAPDYTYGMTKGRLLAFYDEHELLRDPHRVNGEMKFKGKTIAKDEEDDARAEVMNESCKLAEDLFFGCEKGKGKSSLSKERQLDSSDLKGRVFLGRVGPDRKGEGYTNILQVRHLEWGLPKGANWGPAYEGEGGTAETSTAPRRRRKKAAAKKGKGKKGRRK